MSDVKSQLREMVENNISSVEIMSDRLGVENEDVVSLLNEMIGDGSLEGQVTPDGLRFFREKVKVSDAPRIEIEDSGPTFLQYNTRPGKILAILGFAAFIIALVVSFLAAETQSTTLLNVTLLLLGIGLILMMLGGCQISRRPSPM